MKVKRIVANVKTQDINKASYFYKDVLGLDQLMNMDLLQPLDRMKRWTLR